MGKKATPVVRKSADPAFFSPLVSEARRFYLDLDPPKGQNVAVICGGLERCALDYRVQRDTFRYHSLEYVARGRGVLRLGESEYELAPGYIFSYSPKIPHKIVTSQEEPLVKYFVDFDGKGARGLLDSCNLRSERVARVFPPDCLVPLFDQLIESGMRAGGKSTALCEGLLKCLLLKAAEAVAPIEQKESQAFATYQRCRKHVEQNFLRLDSLRQIAEECRLGDAHLCRLFRRYDQQSPYQVLLQLKMNHAASELQQRDLLVKQVAAKVGFEDPFHFSRVFHTTFGLSPAEFRNLRNSGSSKAD